MSTNLFDWAEFEADAADPANHIKFTPVPRQRHRRNGWTEERQSLFLFALSRCGSVSRAARSVGMTARSAYHLLDAPGADDFARAWDEALDEGVERVRADALHRALVGEFVPVLRKGKLVRVEHRRSDRLALALLSGKDRPDELLRVNRVMRREHRQDLKAHDDAKAEEARLRAEAAAAYQAELEAMLEKADQIRRTERMPRVRRL